MDYYDRIEFLLKKNNDTSKNMCRNINLSYNTFSGQKKRKSKNICMQTVQKIANYLQTTAEFLINGNDNLLSINSQEQLIDKKNTIVIFGRNEGKSEYQITDEQLKAIKIILENMKNLPDEDLVINKKNNATSIN